MNIPEVLDKLSCLKNTPNNFWHSTVRFDFTYGHVVSIRFGFFCPIVAITNILNSCHYDNYRVESAADFLKLSWSDTQKIVAAADGYEKHPLFSPTLRQQILKAANICAGIRNITCS